MKIHKFCKNFPNIERETLNLHFQKCRYQESVSSVNREFIEIKIIEIFHNRGLCRYREVPEKLQ